MASGDKWINRVVTDVLKSSLGEGEAIERVIIDARRGEAVRLRIYPADSEPLEDYLEIRECSETGVYEAIVVIDPGGPEEKEMRIA